MTDENKSTLTHQGCATVPLGIEGLNVFHDYWATDWGDCVHSLSYKEVGGQGPTVHGDTCRYEEGAFIVLPNGKCLSAYTEYWLGMRPQYILGDAISPVPVKFADEIQNGRSVRIAYWVSEEEPAPDVPRKQEEDGR